MLRERLKPRGATTRGLRPAAATLGACLLALALVLPGLAQQPAPAPAAPAAAAPASPPAPAQPAPPPVRPAPPPADGSPVIEVDAIRAELDQIEAALNRENQRDAALAELRRRIDPLRGKIRDQLEQVQPRAEELDNRLKQLGPKPGRDAPPEDEAVTKERDELGARFADVDGMVKQGRLLQVRADQLSDRITARRRDIFARELFDRSQSVFHPYLWRDALAALPIEARALTIVFHDARGYAVGRATIGGVIGVIAATLAVIVLLIAIRRLWRARVTPPGAAPRSPLAKAIAGLRALVLGTAEAPIVVSFAYLAADAAGLVAPRTAEIGVGLAYALVIWTLARASARALLAPGESDRRLIPATDQTARLASQLMGTAGALFAFAVAANALHKAVFAPLVLTVATSAIFAGGVMVVVLIALIRLAPAHHEPAPDAAEPATPEAEPRTQWLRILGWLTVLGLFGALASGYIGLAAFAAGRIIIVLIKVAIVWLAVLLIDAFIHEVTEARRPPARKLARALGVQARTVELIGTLVSAIGKIVVVAAGVLVALGPWGILATDSMGSISEGWLNLQFGEVTISLVAVVAGLLVFMVGLLITGTVKRWLTERFLPRTTLDPSLQNSVATILGYIGFIITVGLSLAYLGINLQNIAIVAGALSVGIGFGLQAIVSNFVSGLILLAERPIRVGDTIVVKGEEGTVRKISVRSTEIETFERATVIVPNSDLITGLVKNWTHTNTHGRIIVKVSVPYDCDPDQVRDILMACACENPKILQSSQPRVFLLNFGPTTLDFELRCIVANIDYGLIVRSDLHFQILYRFRKAGIQIQAGSVPATMVLVDERHHDDRSAPPQAVARRPA